MRLQYISFLSALTELSIAAILPRTNASAPTLIQNGRVGSGVLHLPIKHRKRLTKRQDPTSVIFNDGYLYIIELSIGTPPQPVDVQLDTGSSELWVDPSCAASSNPTICNELPRYDPAVSSTAVDQAGTFSIQYGKGGVDGEYWKDTVSIAGVNVTSQRFGVAATSTDDIVGILGVGLGYGFGYPGINEFYTYYEIIDRLYVEAFIKSRAFGLNLGSPSLSEGSIDFGGIDTGKYIGALYKSPMIPYDQSPDGTPRYWFYLTSIGVTQPGSTTSTLLSGPNYAQPLFPDCGATFSQLPPNLFDALIQFFPTAVDDGTGLYHIDCSILNEAGTIDFGFGTKIINVPYSAWFRPYGSDCVFGGVSNANGLSLGDTFMRSAYIVYDQDNFNIHIAQAANCGTNVIPIGSGVDAVPSVTGQCTATSSGSSSSSRAATSSSSSSKPVSSFSSTKSITTAVLSSTKTSTTSSSAKLSTISTSSQTSSKISSLSSKSSSQTSTSSRILSVSTSGTKSSSKSSSLSSTSSKPSTKSSTASSTKSSNPSSQSASKSATTGSQSSPTTKQTTAKGPTTTFVSSYTTNHHRRVTTIIQK